jgi:hypothetical protein
MPVPAILTILILGSAGLLHAQVETGDDWEAEEALPVEIHGFAEGAGSARITKDRAQRDGFVLSEARFRLDLSHYSDRADFSFKGDLVSDGITEDVQIDIRQAVVTLQASSWLDVRAGRQVLTWGTGDLVFLNDIFPKDFVSFFVGREDEFLKAPSNSVKLTFYSDLVNTDLVWTPIFAPDVFITGERLSFFDPTVPGLVGMKTLEQPLQAKPPAKDIDNGELAVRLFRNLGGYELALYGYVGFTKQPLAFDPVADMPTYSSMAVYGSSVRGNFLGGIANVEGAYYNSLKDDDGDDPDIPNSQLSVLFGYERELFTRFNMGLQYYLERIQGYNNLIENSSSPEFEPDEYRHVITTRLTYRLLNETLMLSFFAFATAGQDDIHLRPSLTRYWSDAVTISAGANLMWGDDHRFFGQLENNSNAFVRIRYGF